MRSVVALLLLAACAKHEEPAEQKPQGETVQLSKAQMEAQQLRVEPAQVREVASTLDAPGRISFDDLRVAHVFLPVSGRVVKLLKEPGQHVKKGDALALIESPDAGIALSDAAKAIAARDAAEREYKRQKELYDAHAGAQRDYEQALSAFEQAKAEAARANARAAAFHGSGQQFSLRAPIDGEVIARNASAGLEVAGQYGGNGSPELFTIGSLDPVWVYADVYEVDLSRIRAGAHVSVKVVAWPGRTFEGKVDWVSSALDPASRTARIRCSLHNPAHELLPEMYATVSVDTPARHVLAIPRSAVVHVGDERIVFVQTSQNESGLSTFERRRVVLEDSDSDLIPVKSGVSAGEPVVVNGALLMSGML